MFQMLGQNQVDIVYTLDRRIFNHNYVTAFEAPVDIHFVTGAGHPLAGQTQVTLEQILEYPLILNCLATGLHWMICSRKTARRQCPSWRWAIPS